MKTNRRKFMNPESLFCPINCRVPQQDYELSPTGRCFQEFNMYCNQLNSSIYKNS